MQKNITWLNEAKEMEHHQSKLTYLDTNDRETRQVHAGHKFCGQMYIFIYIHLCRCVTVNISMSTMSLFLGMDRRKREWSEAMGVEG